MTKSQDLQNLKKVLTGKSGNEINQIYNLCATMEIVGGYDQLMNLPIPALQLVLQYVEFVNKQASGKVPKIPKRGR